MRNIVMTLCALVLLSGTAGADTPVGFQKWQIDDTTFRKTVGGVVHNYQKPDKGWAGIVNDFEMDGDSVVYVDKAVLRPRVNRNGTSSVNLTWDDQEYTVTQKLLGIGWLRVSTRQSQWIDSTMTWSNFSVDSNIAKWTGVSPGVDYRVLKNNGSVAHGIFYKPGFVDSAVALYNQRADSLDIALANVMVYTLSANIDDADSAIGDIPKRQLKDLGYYKFNIRDQWLRFPGSDTLPRIPVRQYWERRGTKIICIEYVMMKWVERVHQTYPDVTIWHNDSKVIEGTTNVEDAHIVASSADKNYGVTYQLYVYNSGATVTYTILNRVKNVSTELGVGATISACVLSMYTIGNVADGMVEAYSVFKPWVEGNENGTDNDDGDVTWNDWASDANEWATAGCGSADDGGSDNSGDGTGADRKSTYESTIEVTTVSTWYGIIVSSALAQAWYAGTKNEEGIYLKSPTSGCNNAFYSIEDIGANTPFWTFTYTTGGAPASTLKGRRRVISGGSQ